MTVHVTFGTIGNSGVLLEELGKDKFSERDPKGKIKELGTLITKYITEGSEVDMLIGMIRSVAENAVSQRMLTVEDVKNLDHQAFEMLGKISKKKVALFAFQQEIGEHYDKLSAEQKMHLDESGISREAYIQSRVRETYNQFRGVSNEIINSLWEHYGLSYDARRFLMIFNTQEVGFNEDGISEVCQEYGSTPEFFIDIGEKLGYLGINTTKIRKEIFYDLDESGSIVGNYLDLQNNTASNPDDVKNGFINPNWFLYDIDVETAIKLWGIEKTKYIFGKYFRKGLDGMYPKASMQLPEFYNFPLFRIKINEDEDGNKKKLVDIAQHIFEWELPSDFSHNDLREIITSLRSVISDFCSSGELKRFDHPIQTSVGTKKYRGYFSGAKGFENTHIIDIQGIEKGTKRTLRFATEMGQDAVLFVIMQISYFLKNKKSLSTDILWKQIYELYNNLSLEGVERFDPSATQEQYDLLTHKVIWPLSEEHRREKGKIGKAHNAILYGVYGTGKSQLLTHLIAEKSYRLQNGKQITLDANVINIGIMEFADLLIKSASSFRKRLSDIHENTGKPIILVIEDIDTIIKEQGTNSDPVSQAMTTLFEGVGSLPVTVIASTNNPEILPHRHLRPNRFDTLISFPYPIAESDRKNILTMHWEKQGLNTLLEKKVSTHEILSDIIMPQIEYFTPSHISALCLGIYEVLEFRDINTLSESDIKNIIADVIKNCLVPVSDMKARQKDMTDWKTSLGKDGQNSIGFIKHI